MKLRETPEEKEARMKELERRYDAGEKLSGIQRYQLVMWLASRLTPEQKAELRTKFKTEFEARTSGKVKSVLRRMTNT